jgi:hypothetical protein
MSKHSKGMKIDEYVAWLGITIVVLAVFWGGIATALFAKPQGTQFHDATLVRDDIGYALSCWTVTGEDIFCQEVITP